MSVDFLKHPNSLPILTDSDISQAKAGFLPLVKEQTVLGPPLSWPPWLGLESRGTCVWGHVLSSLPQSPLLLMVSHLFVTCLIPGLGWGAADRSPFPLGCALFQD